MQCAQRFKPARSSATPRANAGADGAARADRRNSQKVLVRAIGNAFQRARPRLERFALAVRWNRRPPPTAGASGSGNRLGRNVRTAPGRAAFWHSNWAASCSWGKNFSQFFCGNSIVRPTVPNGSIPGAPPPSSRPRWPGPPTHKSGFGDDSSGLARRFGELLTDALIVGAAASHVKAIRPFVCTPMGLKSRRGFGRIGVRYLESAGERTCICRVGRSII